MHIHRAATILLLFLLAIKATDRNEKNQIPPLLRIAQEDDPMNDTASNSSNFPDACHAALLNADTDVSTPGSIFPQEYVAFAQLLGPPGLIETVERFFDLPIPYTTAFFGLACLCNNPTYGGDPNDDDCRLGQNTSVRIPAVPGVEQSMEDFRYLYLICGLTDEAAKATLRGMRTDVPTISPTGSLTDDPTIGNSDEYSHRIC